MSATAPIVAEVEAVTAREYAFPREPAPIMRKEGGIEGGEIDPIAGETRTRSGASGRGEQDEVEKRSRKWEQSALNTVKQL